jgi:hypothetical protein
MNFRACVVGHSRWSFFRPSQNGWANLAERTWLVGQGMRERHSSKRGTIYETVGPLLASPAALEDRWPPRPRHHANEGHKQDGTGQTRVGDYVPRIVEHDAEPSVPRIARTNITQCEELSNHAMEIFLRDRLNHIKLRGNSIHVGGCARYVSEQRTKTKGTSHQTHEAGLLVWAGPPLGRPWCGMKVCLPQPEQKNFSMATLPYVAKRRFLGGQTCLSVIAFSRTARARKGAAVAGARRATGLLFLGRCQLAVGI